MKASNETFTLSNGEIDIRNGEFLALSRNEKKVEICKHIIRMLDARKFVSKEKTYICITAYEKFDEPHLADVPELVENDPKCKACAVGSVVLAFMDKGFSVEEKADLYQKDLSKQVNGIFTRRELQLMECAFEKNDSQVNWWKGSKKGKTDKIVDDILEAIEFGDNFNTSEETHRAICNRIIDNGGKW